MSEQEKTPEAHISALTVQRDSAHRARDKAETQNRALLAHQKDIRDWVRDAIAQWEAALESGNPYAAAHRIHLRAIELLGEAENFL